MKRRSALLPCTIIGFVSLFQASDYAFDVPGISIARNGRFAGVVPELSRPFGIVPNFNTETSRRTVRACTDEDGKAVAVKLSSVPESTANLVKNIVGSGMLSLPAGVAAFSGSPKALIPAVALVLLFGLMSAYGFVLIADACNASGKATYQDAWASIVSPSSKWLISLACLANAIIGNICYSMVLGDCISMILSPLGLPAYVSGSGTCLIALTVAVLLPLCCLKSLAPLAKFSAMGVLSNVYISLFIVLRCLDGSYRPGGALFSAAPVAPHFAATAGNALSTAMCPGVTVLLSILGTAFLAHYNAARFYDELAPNAAGERGGPFFKMSVMAFTAAAVINAIVMVGGFLTFGSSSAGLILNNYAATDGLAAAARAAIGVSLTCSYPIVFFSVREQILSFLGEAGKKFAAERPNAFSTLLLAGITALALKLTDLGKVAGFAGATFGIVLIYIAPPLMALRARQRAMSKPTGRLARRLAPVFQVLLIPLGAALGVIGAAQCLK